MNVLRTISHVLVMAAMVFASSGIATEFRKTTHAFSHTVLINEFLMNEKKASKIFGEKYISARNQVIIGKAVWGGMSNVITDLETLEEIIQDPVYSEQDRTNARNKIRPGYYKKFPVYVVVDGVLRVGGNKYLLLDEESIDKKCDEYLSENAAWFAKPVIKGAVDFAYKYVAAQLVRGIANGINQSQE